MQQDPERSLTLQEKIVELYQNVNIKSKAQLIFTTHNTALLDSDLFRRDQIYFIEKNRYGSSLLYSLYDYKIRKDAAFEKNYLIGKFGAIPIVSDISEIFGENFKDEE